MMACSLLSTSLSYRSRHKAEINDWIFIKTYVHESLKRRGCASDRVPFRNIISFFIPSDISVAQDPIKNVMYFTLENIS